MDPAASMSVVRLVNTYPVIGTFPLGLSLTTQRLDVLLQELE
jgi:hypothetical protein